MYVGGGWVWACNLGQSDMYSDQHLVRAYDDDVDDDDDVDKED